MDLTNEQLQKPKVTANYFYESLSKSKPSVGECDLEKQIKFTEELEWKVEYVIIIQILQRAYFIIFIIL